MWLSPTLSFCCYAAVAADKLETARQMLAKHKSADVNWVNKEDAGMTALIKACSLGYAGCAQLLVAFGAQLDVLTEWGVTALSLACCIGHEDCVQLLADAGAALDTRGRGVRSFAFKVCHSLFTPFALQGFTALATACFEGQIGCARRLILAGARTDIFDSEVRGIFFSASPASSHRTLRCMCSTKGATALDIALSHRSLRTELYINKHSRSTPIGNLSSRAARIILSHRTCS